MAMRKHPGWLPSFRSQRSFLTERDCVRRTSRSALMVVRGEIDVCASCVWMCYG